MRLLLTLLPIFVFIVNWGQLWADPIVGYTQGTNGRAETVHALIRKTDLHTGEPTRANRTLAAKVRSMGKKGDNCGHIVANVLGGRMLPHNLFPQNAQVNSGEFRNNVEEHMQKFLENDQDGSHTIDYIAELIYDTPDDTRPTKLMFRIEFLKNAKLIPFQQIPRNRRHQVPSNPYVGVIINP